MSNKAIVLTHAPIDSWELELIRKSGIYVMVVNWAYYPYKENSLRLYFDYMYTPEYLTEEDRPQDLITSYHLRCCPDVCQYKDHPRIHMIFDVANEPNNGQENALYFNTSSLIPSIDYCVKYKKSEEILIVGTNDVYGDRFTKAVNKAIKLFKPHVEMFKYRQDAKFFLKHKTIQEFIGA